MAVKAVRCQQAWVQRHPIHPPLFQILNNKRSPHYESPPLFRIHNTRASPSAKAYFPHVRQTSTTSKLEPNLGDTRFISFVCTPCQLNDTSMDSIKKLHVVGAELFHIFSQNLLIFFIMFFKFSSTFDPVL